MIKTGGIILAAGKGKRMKFKTQNKVTVKLGNRPMILHAVRLLKSAGVLPIVIVVGFAKESVKALFSGDVIFAEQKKRLGTAHAAAKGVRVFEKDVKNVFVVNGDDSAFYTKDIFNKLNHKHLEKNASITLLTLKVKNPTGLGRIVRGKDGKIKKIVEEKDATRAQRKINEINPGCYLFDVDFLKENLGKVKKSRKTNEYYLVSLIDIAVKEGKRVETVDGGNILWRGVNTKEELQVAQKLYKKHKQNYL